MSTEGSREGNHQALDVRIITRTHSDTPSWSPVLVLDRQQPPSTWIHVLVEDAKQRSNGIVEHHLVGATLERRFKGIGISNYPAHSGNQRTSRTGDFVMSRVVYHVTTTPIQGIIQECAEDIRAGLQPVLLVPAEQKNKAHMLAQNEGIDKEVSVISIEAFIALTLIHLAIDEDKDFSVVLKEIVEIYNRRLAAVESDMSLQLQVR